MQMYRFLRVQFFPPLKWDAPPVELFKVNFDASWVKEQNDVKIGAMIRDYRGEFFASMSKLGGKVALVEAAEFVATREAIMFAVDADFRDIVLEGDNLGVINAIWQDEEAMSSAGAIVANIRV